MQVTMSHTQDEKLTRFCQDAKQLILAGDYEKCREMVSTIMGEYPDAPHPHNILGVLLEKTGHHADAMRHFRAALALDSTYRPASQNLETYGTFYSSGASAFDEEDCIPVHKDCCSVIFDAQNIGHVVRRSGNEFI